MQRRLAAILAADVVGYSRLMGVDETGTLTRLKAHRSELIDPANAARGGRIVKLMGDGALVEFARAVAAVECAVEIQRAMARSNAGVPEARRIAFRIGINTGDVIVEGDDIYGVNVAARLEGLAEPGRGLHLGQGPRRSEGSPRPVLRGPRRAAGQEHRPPGQDLQGRPVACRRPRRTMRRGAGLPTRRTSRRSSSWSSRT